MRLSTTFLLGLSGLAGFALMVVEMTATRLMAPYFGSSVFVWTSVLGAIMAALGLGYYIGGRLADRWPRVETALGLLALSGLLTAITPFAASWLSAAVAVPDGAFLSGMPLFLRASLVVALTVFAPPVFVVGAISPVVVRLIASTAHVGWASGANSAAGTAGAILGTFAPTIWLVPTLGSRRTLLAIAVLQLLFVAAALLWWRRSRPLAAGAAGAALLALLGFNAPANAIGGRSGVLEATETEYQFVKVQQEGPRRLMRLENQAVGAQSTLIGDSFLSGVPHDAFLLAPFLAQRPPGAPLRVLMLGMAAGTTARQLHHFFGPTHQLTIDGVDIDGRLFALGKEYFKLAEVPETVLTMHVADGRAYLAASRGNWDVIILDVFASELFIPFQLATREFFDLLAERLAPGGVLVFNAVGSAPPSRLIDALSATVGAAFPDLLRLRLPGSWNFLFYARRAAPFDMMSAGATIATYPGADRSIGEADALRGLLLDYLFDSTPVRSTAGATILTDDHAPIEWLTLRDMQRSWQR